MWISIADEVSRLLSFSADSTDDMAAAVAARAAHTMRDKSAYAAAELATVLSSHNDQLGPSAQQPDDATPLYTATERQMILDNYDLEGECAELAVQLVSSLLC